MQRTVAPNAPPKCRHGAGWWGPGGDRYTFVVTGEDSGGSCFILEAHVPVGGGPPLHAHLAEEETFYLVEGSLILTVDGRDQPMCAGQSVLVPRGVPHTYRNPGPQPARMLVVFSPAGMEHWFAECLMPVVNADEQPPAPSPEMVARMLEAGPRHNVRWHGL
jgi:quercetin dioxygenase-like cupin family protein